MSGIVLIKSWQPYYPGLLRHLPSFTPLLHTPPSAKSQTTGTAARISHPENVATFLSNIIESVGEPTVLPRFLAGLGRRWKTWNVPIGKQVKNFASKTRGLD